jgi:DNA polymerase-3 subunit epsilon
VGRKHPKSPNLGEAYEFFTGRKLVNAHDAAVDVAACKAVYLALKERAA